MNKSMQPAFSSFFISFLFNALTIIVFIYTLPVTAADVESDLRVSFGSEGDGFVIGKVTNESANSYPCVRLKFFLIKGSRKSGFFSTEVRDIRPRSTVSYKAKLPELDPSFGLESTSVCQEGSVTAPQRPSGAPPPTLRPPFAQIRICGKVEDFPNKPFQCKGPDKTFGREVEALVRFSHLSRGKHTLTKTYFWGDRYNGRFKRIRSEKQTFINPKTGEVEIAIKGSNRKHGVWRLDLKVDGSRTSSIQYCILASCR